MTETEYVEAALKRLPPIDPNEMEYVDNCIRDCFRRKFTLEDAIAFTKLTEHVNPNLSENVALKRMRRITDKYANDGSKLPITPILMNGHGF